MTSSLTPFTAQVTEDISLPASVRAFCEERGLIPLIGSIAKLAQSSFDLGEPPILLMGADPESSEEWLEIVVTARGTVKEVHEAYREFTRRWLASMPRLVQDNVRLVLLAE